MFLLKYVKCKGKKISRKSRKNHKEIIEIWKLWYSLFKSNSKVKVFRKKSQGHKGKCRYPRKGLVTYNTPMKYQSSSTNFSKVNS